MTYAGERLILDADSHLMELPDFLEAHADRTSLDLLPRLGDITTGQFDPGRHVGRAGHSPEVVERLIQLGDNLTRGPKWHDALGAFNGAERGRALDLLGFRLQVVFSSFCARPTFEAPLAHRYPIARAHNRAMAAFCSGDRRLIGVAIVPLDDPAQALAEIDHATALGLRAAWISADAPGGRSPGHPAHEPIWRALAERGMPFILHVGSSSLQIPPPWMNDGYPDRVTARGGAEVIGSKDLTVIHHAAQRFISTLVLDGVLDRHPGLRGGVIEIGAGWAPDMIRRLDHAADIWAKSEPHLALMKRKPSEQIRDQIRFTPYPFEDVAALVRESSAELYMFSSDYPHAEGGRDPIGRFERALSGTDEKTHRLFFSENLRTLYPGLAAAPDGRSAALAF
jgi:predicted TIM-barrel fold metal-dependent hydrolase